MVSAITGPPLLVGSNLLHSSRSFGFRRAQEVGPGSGYPRIEARLSCCIGSTAMGKKSRNTKAAAGSGAPTPTPALPASQALDLLGADDSVTQRLGELLDSIR